MYCVQKLYIGLGKKREEIKSIKAKAIEKQSNKNIISPIKMRNTQESQDPVCNYIVFEFLTAKRLGYTNYQIQQTYIFVKYHDFKI